MSQGFRFIGLGMFILVLSLVLWNTTASFWGWLILFVPGALYVFLGCIFVVDD